MGEWVYPTVPGTGGTYKRGAGIVWPGSGHARVVYQPDPDGPAYRATITAVKADGETLIYPRREPTDYRFELRLDAGGEVSDVPAVHLVARYEGDWIIHRLADLYRGTASHVHNGTTAVSTVALDEFRTGPYGGVSDPQVPVDVDLLGDALALVAKAHAEIDTDERELIRGMRRRGASWEQIGLAMGSPAKSARQRAQARYKRLGGDPAKAVPDTTPEGTEQ